MKIRSLCAAAATVAVTGALTLAFTGTASAAPGGGCPDGGDWVGPVTTAIFIDQLDNGNVADQNGDGLACFRVNKGQTDKHDGIPSFTWKDNTNPV